MNAASKPAAAASLLFLLILVTQIVVPGIQLSKPRPARFGWQMFCDYKPLPRYWVVRGDGTTREIDVPALVGVRRLDADFHGALPDYLLRTQPDAVAVRWQWPDAEEIEEYR